MRGDDRWNHNTHYYGLVADAAPPDARTALDVGTGDGLLAVRLAEQIPEVTGIDADADILARAIRRGGSLVVIGCARSSTASDIALDAVGALQHQVYSRTRGFWQHNAPVRLQFPHTYTEVSSIPVGGRVRLEPHPGRGAQKKPGGEGGRGQCPSAPWAERRGRPAVARCGGRGQPVVVRCESPGRPAVAWSACAVAWGKTVSRGMRKRRW